MPGNNMQQPERTTGGYVVSGLRPRIFIRNDSSDIGRGVTLSGLLKRAASESYSEWVEYEGPLEHWHQLPCVAMRYLLKGDREDAIAVGKFLAEKPYPKDLTAYGAAFGGAALDWVRDALPEEMAKKAADKLVEGIDPLYHSLEHPSINHNYTYVSLYALAVGALAVYGEGPEYTERAEKYLRRVKSLLEDEGMALDTFRNKEGVWAEGNHYSPYVVYTPFLMTLAALTSSTDHDYFGIIREQYDNFLIPMGKYIVANMRPDFTLERIGDMGSRWVNPNDTQMRPIVELIAKEQGDPVFMGQLRSFCEEMQRYHGKTLIPSYYRWMMLFIYDDSLPTEPSYKTLPVFMRLGKNAYEQIMMRNGWDESSTLITTVCGDHYTDHQHFDKGSFLVYHRGGLAIDSGAYTSMYKNNWSNYAVRTLAHNCVLLEDPEEEPFESVSGTMVYPDGGQRVIRGAQGHRSWQAYLEMRKEHGLDTARVVACEYDDDNGCYGYVKSDLTKAYGEKALLVERQLVYLPADDYLVVKDRVVSGKPLKKSWLLHFIEKPCIDGKFPGNGVTEYPGGSIVRVERTGELELTGKTVEYGGALMVKALMPARAVITAVGGEGYRCYNRIVGMDFDDPRDPSFNPFAPIRESGEWRIETSSGKPEEQTVFLHALEIADADKKEMVHTEYIESSEGLAEGVLFKGPTAGRLVMFRKGAQKVEYENEDGREPLLIEYNMDSMVPTLHILTELPPDTEFAVEINGSFTGVYRSTKSGIVTFGDNGIGRGGKVIIKEKSGSGRS